jgi:hypothetical protein
MILLITTFNLCAGSKKKKKKLLITRFTVLTCDRQSVEKIIVDWSVQK